MADAKVEEFDANERIAGFSMLSIKRVIQSVGMMEDRDDIDQVARSLGCPQQQAIRVLEELERRELVTKAPKKRQWVATPKGNRLAFHWHPPRVLRPAIEYDAGRGSINEQFTAVPCSIWRYTPDEEEMFEEGELDVGIHVDYDSERLIEINISQIDEYQGESHGASVCERSVYISATDAKSFVAGLQKAIARAEKESALRESQKARQAKRHQAKDLRRARKEDEHLAQVAAGESGPRASLSAKPQSAPKTSKTSTKRRPSIYRMPAPPPAPARPEEATRSGRAVATALAELREANRGRLEAAKKAARKADE